MNERIYWDEFDAALRPAVGVVAVLLAVLLASLTLPAVARHARSVPAALPAPAEQVSPPLHIPSATQPCTCRQRQGDLST